MPDRGDEISWDDLAQEDWDALDRANDEVGREEADENNLGSVSDRADAAADILGGLAGDSAVDALGKEE